MSDSARIVTDLGKISSQVLNCRVSENRQALQGQQQHNICSTLDSTTTTRIRKSTKASTTMFLKAIALSASFHALVVASFQPMMTTPVRNASALKSTASEASSYLYKPDERDAHYKGDIAQYLVDLHNEKATFNFCGGMMFQLVLSEKLKAHLETAANPTNRL